MILIANVFGVRAYGELEFFGSLLKLVVVIIFVIIGIVLNVGGGKADTPYESYLGGEYWRSPGAFANGFRGVCAVFVTAAFSFGALGSSEACGSLADPTLPFLDPCHPPAPPSFAPPCNSGNRARRYRGHRDSEPSQVAADRGQGNLLAHCRQRAAPGDRGRS